MSHLDEGTLHALLDGELELAEVREIQLHLGSCAACGSRLQDVKQFLAEADRLVGVMEVPMSAHHEASSAAELPAHESAAAARDPQPRPLREPLSWEEPPVLLLPDPLDSQERRKRWMRGLRLAAMIVVVVMGGKLLSNALRPGKPQLQFTERDLAPQAATAPAVVSPEERTRPVTPAPTTVLGSKQPRPAPPARAPVPKPAAAAKVVATQPASDTSADQLDSIATVSEDTTPTEEVLAAAAPDNEPTAGGSEPGSRQDADLETRRAAAAALAELDRERLRSRANAATSALPGARPETTQAAEAPAAPRTLEQRSQIYLRIGLDEAVRQLGRPVHVIEAMSPQFIGLTQGRNVPGADAGRPVVRVVYLDPRGRMILLDQQRLRAGQAPGAAAGSLRWTLGDVMLYLHGEPGADVLTNLQKRVR
jgi:anti-sigma factor RsiW